MGDEEEEFGDDAVDALMEGLVFGAGGHRVLPGGAEDEEAEGSVVDVGEENDAANSSQGSMALEIAERLAAERAAERESGGPEAVEAGPWDAFAQAHGPGRGEEQQHDGLNEGSGGGNEPRADPPNGDSSGGEPGEGLAPGLPFNPPEQVQRWMRPEDWQALAQAWEQAEAQALHFEGDLVPYEEAAPQFSAHAPRRQRRRRRPEWDKDFNLVGCDTGKPPPLRRYFDHIPGENTVPKEAPPSRVIQALKLPNGTAESGQSSQHDQSTSSRNSRPRQGHRPEWVESFQQTVSVDNDRLHPFLRHFFDRRGLEASYRTRPDLDKVTPVLRPRTPKRPSTREKIMKFSVSEPALPQEGDLKARAEGNIHWGRRCLMYGPDLAVKKSPDKKRLPWVADHHRSETEDNEMLNPMLRHYFDADGIESSFRNRGRHYGRPMKVIKAIQMPSPSSSGGGPQRGSRRGSSVTSLSIGSSDYSLISRLTMSDGQGARGQTSGSVGSASEGSLHSGIGMGYGSQRASVPVSIHGSQRASPHGSAPGSVHGSQRVSAAGSVQGSVRSRGIGVPCR